MLKSQAIRILLVDDHPVLRAGLANLLRLETGLEVAGEAGSGEAALQMWRTCRPDVCLLDLSMPGFGGLDTIRRIRELESDAGIVVLTSSESAEHASRALAAGAAAYVTKNVDFLEIVTAIRAVHAGETNIRKGVSTVRQPTAPLVSPRELEVLSEIRLGASNAEIGRKLGIAERTVKFHVAALLDKLGACDRAGAVAKGFEAGLLSLDGP